jgi:hypothetical protein
VVFTVFVALGGFLLTGGLLMGWRLLAFGFVASGVGVLRWRNGNRGIYRYGFDGGFQSDALLFGLFGGRACPRL